jgi:hypothetical protein
MHETVPVDVSNRASQFDPEFNGLRNGQAAARLQIGTQGAGGVISNQ